METQSLIQNIKQEPDYETVTNMETQSLIPRGEVKQEPDYEVQTVKKEANGEEESYMFLVAKWASRSSPSLDENMFLYCEKCQLKYEGGCPEHRAFTYVDNAGECQDEGYIQEFSPQVQVVDNKDRQVLGSEKVEQSKVCEDHSDDVGSLPKITCSTESDQMLSVCKINTELCVAGTSCGAHSNVEIKAGEYIHNSEKPYKCDVCCFGFTRQGGLKRHMRTHTGEKPYKCDICGLGFTRPGDLTIHKRKHTGEKPYKCDMCGIGFVESRTLKMHKRIHTGEKPYSCDVCGFGFTQQGHLKKHKRTHTGEKPYTCDVCGFRFNQQGHLQRHKRIHTGEKPYKCNECGAGFVQSSALNIHMRTHTGEKPYKCDVCGLGFTQQGNLRTHKKTHT